MKKIVVLASAIALGGCAGLDEVKAPTDAMNSLQGSQLTVVTYKKSPFTAMTYGKAALGGLFGAVGGAAAALSSLSEGDQIIQDNDVPDPAQAISSRLVPALTEKLKPSISNTIKDRDPDASGANDLVTAAGGKGAVLDVQTINWMFVYFSFDWTHYHILYTARARLIDANSGKLLAQAPCKYDSSDEKSPPDYDQMLANKAAVLKEMLRKATDTCADQMEKSLIGPGG